MNNQDKTIEELRLEIDRLQEDNKALLKLASHDLRAPLNKIFALVNLLKMTDNALSAEQQGYLDNIEVVLSDSLRLLRNLTDLRTIENNQLRVQWQNVDLAVLVRKIRREFMPAADRKQIRITAELEPVKATTDSQVVARILDQLISNALKFSPPQTEIVIRLEAGEDVLSITVVDGGFGIKDEEQDGLFTKFKTLSTPTSGGESKTGLGLYLAQENAKLLGGRISYKNNNGSVFKLELPIVRLA